MLCLAAHLGAECPRGMWTTPNSNGLADSELRRLVETGRCGITTKTDTWTASIVDLSYPPMLSRSLRLDILEVTSAARSWAGEGPGMGCGGMSREGGYWSEDCDGFERPLMSASPSIVIVVGSGIGRIGGLVGGVGTGGTWVLFGSLT